jgi:hypothetical protein
MIRERPALWLLLYLNTAALLLADWLARNLKS